MECLNQLLLTSMQLFKDKSISVATYPLAGGRHEGSWVRLPRKENAQSCHQCLFEENVKKKPERCGLQTLSVKDSGVVFTHGEDISTPRVRHKG